jgi:hypothetical protein
MPAQLKYLVYGTGMAAGALLGAWLLNAVFEQSWEAIALILLAMLIVTLGRRMIIGAIPLAPLPRKEPDHGPRRPDLWAETAHLPGVDYRYGWMALPAVFALAGVILSLLL